MRTDEFLGRLEGVKPTGHNQWMALCPGHHDKSPSLSIKEADDNILLYCFAGCELADILRPLNLEVKDISPDNHKSKPGQRRIAAIYHYIDANSRPFEVVRTEPKGFYQRQPDGAGGYVNNIQGIIPTLYRVGDLKRAIAGNGVIFVTEGEKDADRLRGLGLVATTCLGGAGKWRDSYSETLRGADVVVIPDKDKPGRIHAEKVAASLHGIAASVKVLELPGVCTDVAEWLDNGNDIGQLKELADRCFTYEPSDNGVRLWRMADVDIETVSWLWKPYIPQGKLTLLEGDPGIGKSWVSLAIASAVTLGRGLPGQEPGEPARVLIASAEDGLGDTIRPRLDTMGADVSRIFAIDGALMLDVSGFTLLESYLGNLSPSLLIIDPLVAYLGAAVDIHRANEVRAVMTQLARLAKQFDVAIVAIRHLTKGGASRPIYRGLGSIDFTAACRSVVLAGCDSEDSQNRALVHIKSNLAPTGPSIGYELREGGFYWTGESTLTAAQILAADSGERKTAINDAVDFLRAELGDGPVEAAQVWRDAGEAELSEKTVKRAKSMLKIITKRHGETGKRGGGKFTWELPERHLEGQSDLGGQGGHIKKNDPLNDFSFRNTPQGSGDDPLNTKTPLAGLPCEKAPGICTLRTDASLPFQCNEPPGRCQFIKSDC